MIWKGQLKTDVHSWLHKSIVSVFFKSVEVLGLKAIANVKLYKKLINPISQHILHVGCYKVHSSLNANENFQNVDGWIEIGKENTTWSIL